MGQFWSQSFFIPAPPLTEKNLPDQTGKVHIVTGGYTGVGLELATILYQKNATVYIAGRSESKYKDGLSKIQSRVPQSSGRLEFLKLDLADLTTIKKSAEEFMSKEDRLDVLTNNAGVMQPPKGTQSAQGYDIQMATNCLGPYLFTQCLLPILKRTAASSPPNTVRVTWAGSLGIHIGSPSGGIQFNSDDSPKVQSQPAIEYGQTKVGNFWLGTEFARRYGRDGIISVSWNPGNLTSELQRHTSMILMLLTGWLLHPTVFGAYTELYAGWSTDIDQSKNGTYIVPWGRDGLATMKKDVLLGSKSTKEGGTGTAEKFWEWCDKETKKYM